MVEKTRARLKASAHSIIETMAELIELIDKLSSKKVLL